MKRNIDLTYEILKRAEKGRIRDHGTHIALDFSIDDITGEMIRYHFELCKNAKFLFSTSKHSLGFKQYELSWKGHDFIEEYERENGLA